MTKRRVPNYPVTNVASLRLESGPLALQAVVALTCVLIISYVGGAAFYIPKTQVLTLGPLAGVVAALACRKWWLAAPVAGAGVILGTLLASAYSTFHPGESWFLAGYWWVPAIAVLIGLGAAALVERHEGLVRWLVWLGVGLIILSTCLAGWTIATKFVTSVGTTPVEFFRQTPSLSANAMDDEIYLLTIHRMDTGSGYYAAMGKTLAELNQVRTSGFNDASNPTSFRLPTLFWFLAALPRSVLSWVIAMLVLTAAAILAAHSIAARYTQPAVALVGTTIVGVYLACFTTESLLLCEEWAGLLGLVAVSLAIKSLSVRFHPLVWASAAASVALLATLTRELAVAYLLVGLASTLVVERTRSQRLWVPWAVGLGLAALGYLAHAQAVVAISRTLPAVPYSGFRLHAWFDPTGRGLAGGVKDLAIYSWSTVLVAWTIWVLGSLGGLIAPRDWPRRILLAGVTAGGAIALFLVHPPAAPGFPIPSYWGFVVLPTVVACAPLAFARIPGLMRVPGS